jgi:potassium efflux system protein
MLGQINESLAPIALVWNHKLFTIGGVKLSLGNLIMALTMLLFATRISRLVSRFIDRRFIVPLVDDKSSQNTYRTFAFYVTLAAFIALSLAVAGIPLTIFTVFGGALAIGVGFGSQNIVNNFISGIILLVERPIKVGDVVEVDGVTGSVESIGTRSTRLKTSEGKIQVVPNSFFLEKSILNWSYESSIVRTTVGFGVAYGSDVSKVRAVCEDILHSSPDIVAKPAPLVVFDNFSESNLDFQLHFWCDLNNPKAFFEIRSAIRFRIEEEFRKQHIEMAFPQRDMNIRLSKPLDVKVLN